MANKFSGLSLMQVDESLTKFWKIEEVQPSDRSFTVEEERCVKHFKNNYGFAPNEKFVVKLRLKVPRSAIADTKKLTERSLIHVENKLSCHPI